MVNKYSFIFVPRPNGITKLTAIITEELGIGLTDKSGALENNKACTVQVNSLRRTAKARQLGNKRKSRGAY